MCVCVFACMSEDIGKHGYYPPEVYQCKFLKDNKIHTSNMIGNSDIDRNDILLGFDGQLADAWNVGICIGIILTGYKLYDIPCVNKDENFKILWKYHTLKIFLNKYHRKTYFICDLSLNLIDSLLSHCNQRATVSHCLKTNQNSKFYLWFIFFWFFFLFSAALFCCIYCFCETQYFFRFLFWFCFVFLLPICFVTLTLKFIEKQKKINEKTNSNKDFQKQ